MIPYMPWTIHGCTSLTRVLVEKSGFFRALGTILRACLLAVFHALQIKRSTYDVVAHARQILDTAAAHQHHRVLLQVVPFTADVRNHFESIGKANLGNLAQCGVGFLWRGGIDAGADTTALRAVFKSGALRSAEHTSELQ